MIYSGSLFGEVSLGLWVFRNLLQSLSDYYSRCGPSLLGMNPNCLYAEPGDWTWVAAVQGEAANQYTLN